MVRRIAREGFLPLINSSIAIQTAILNSFRNMFGGDAARAVEIGDAYYRRRFAFIVDAQFLPGNRRNFDLNIDAVQ